MKKAKAFRILNRVKQQQILDAPYITFPEDYEFLDFITVYYNIGVMKNLRYANTVDEALSVVEALPSSAKIALGIGDEFRD